MAEHDDVQQQQSLEKFREMVLAEKDLVPCTEDGFLLKFLRTWDFDIAKSFTLLQNYYKLRSDYAHLYKNFSLLSPHINVINDYKFVNALTQPDQHGRTVIVSHFGKWDPNRSSFDDLFVCFHMLLEILIEKDVRTQLKGVVLIIDLEGVTFQHAKQVTPANLTRLITLIEKSFPVWFHAFHFANENFIFKMFLTLVWPFLSKSMTERIYLHGKNLESLHQHVSPDILPQEFGGLQPPTYSKTLLEKFLSYEDYLQKINSFGYKTV